jgi:iron-sulfur cluster assembly protein
MITLTENAVDKVKEFIAAQSEPYSGIRISVVAGGCSGFEYKMNLEKESRSDDQILDTDGVKVFVDQQSMLYLDGTRIDFLESTRGAGFSFENPNSSGTCGCGESFNV